jgi:hypothetical protein
VTPTTRELRDHLEEAAAPRRRGDHGAADAAELAALILLRSILGAVPKPDLAGGKACI